jgi:hypothetical protein
MGESYLVSTDFVADLERKCKEAIKTSLQASYEAEPDDENVKLSSSSLLRASLGASSDSVSLTSSAAQPKKGKQAETKKPTKGPSASDQLKDVLFL